MTKAINGALLSAFVFPGLGHIVLKEYLRGIVVLLGFLAGLVVCVIIAVQRGLAILETIELQGGAINLSAISNAAAQSISSSGSLLFKLLFLWIFCCWIAGIADAYRIGRKKDKEAD